MKTSTPRRLLTSVAVALCAATTLPAAPASDATDGDVSLSFPESPGENITYFTINDGDDFIRSPMPQSLSVDGGGTASQSLKTNGSVVLDIDAAAGYADVGFYFAFGRLDDLESIVLGWASGSDDVRLNLYFDVDGDGQFFTWVDNVLDDVAPDKYATISGTFPDQVVVNDSTTFNVVGEGSHTLGDLKSGAVSGIGANTIVGIWIGNSVTSGNYDAAAASLTVNNVELLWVSDGTYFNGFESDEDGWFDFVEGVIERTASETNGIPSSEGDWHAVIDGSVFSRWGRYEHTFPEHGYVTEIDIYLDMAEADGSEKHFDWSSAINGPSGVHRRDFIFNVATSDGVVGEWLVGASNNTRCTAPPLAPVIIGETGWYTFRHTFQDVDGVLAVLMEVFDSDGNLVGSWTRSNPTDLIGATVGGNRYGWFADGCFDPDSLAIDSTRKFERGPAELAFDPTSLDFGGVEIGTTSAPQTATLQNVGDFDATVLTFTPPGAGFAADTSDCGATLTAGAICEVDVTFTPSATGPTGATLVVDSDEGAASALALAGTGLSESGVFSPVTLQVDAEPHASDANGIFEPAEIVEVSPSWRNDGIAAQILTGTASGFVGPPGADYDLALGIADYGEVDSGSMTSCRDTGLCYLLGVDDPAARPATHWDATVDEVVSDGTATTWVLHVGDSFLDVPRTSPFYPSVETLLHSGVTGGCTDIAYCPAGVNSRAQMPVFMLTALEGPGYTPPACSEGDETFVDVPFDHPFCPWIEDLADREILSGCGADAYCPDDPVTRAQMAIFLLKTLEGSGYTPPECEGIFADVPCTSVFAAWVEDLHHRGITGGCGSDPLRYCPVDAVRRAQMAVFVTETFGLALYGP